MDFLILFGICSLYVGIAYLLYRVWLYLVDKICIHVFSGYYYEGILILGMPTLLLIFSLSYCGLRLILP